MARHRTPSPTAPAPTASPSVPEVASAPTPSAVSEAFLGARTFGQLRDRLGIASDVLSTRLTALVEQGVLVKSPNQEPGQRTRDAYDLTPAGEELKTVMVALQQWGETHVPQPQGSRVLPLTTGAHERVRAALVDPHGGLVPGADVVFVRRDARPTPA